MVYVTIKTEIEVDKILYTLDGSDPTEKNALEYKEPFPLYNDTVVKTIAVKEEWLDSEVVTREIKVNASTPVMRVDSTRSDYVDLSVANLSDYEGTKDIRIYWTNDGSMPSKESPSFGVHDIFRISRNKSYRFSAAGSESGLSYLPFDFSSPSLRVCSIEKEEFYYAPERTMEVTLSTPTEGATIHYTLDGTNPTEESDVYEKKLLLFNKNFTLKAIAMKEGIDNSELFKERIKVVLPSPQFVYNPDNKTVELTNEDEYDPDTDSIYYSLDGSEPSEESNKYTFGTPIPSIEKGTLIKSIAIDSSLRRSKVVSFEA